MRIPDHYNIHNYFVFDGKSSMDFDLGISGDGTFAKPHRRVERFTIPGRNGTLTISDDTFEDVEITYPCYFANGFAIKYQGLMDWLYSKKGMLRLEDTYHPEHFRLAEFVGDVSPDMGTMNFSGRFDLTFRCDGRLFLKSGERIYAFSSDDQKKVYSGYYSVDFINPTSYASKPLIGLTEPGTIVFNGERSVKIELGASFTRNKEKPYGIGLDVGYAVFDCESCESYDYLTGESNNKYTTIEGKIPVLSPGMNWIAARNDAHEAIPFMVIPRWFGL